MASSLPEKEGDVHRHFATARQLRHHPPAAARALRLAGELGPFSAGYCVCLVTSELRSSMHQTLRLQWQWLRRLRLTRHSNCNCHCKRVARLNSIAAASGVFLQRYKRAFQSSAWVGFSPPVGLQRDTVGNYCRFFPADELCSAGYYSALA